MNNKLAAKMNLIKNQFGAAGVSLPKTGNRHEIEPARFAGSRGVKIGGRFVWGVSPREYWKFLKTQSKD